MVQRDTTVPPSTAAIASPATKRKLTRSQLCVFAVNHESNVVQTGANPHAAQITSPIADSLVGFVFAQLLLGTEGLGVVEEPIRLAQTGNTTIPCVRRSVHAPRRSLWPVPQSLGGPSGALVCMASRTGIRDFIFVGHCGGYEGKGMRSHLHIRNCYFDFGHVTSNATASCRVFFVMRMLFDGGGARAIQRKGTVTIHAEFVRWFSQLCVIVRAMHIVATKAGHAATVHHTLYKIIPLHTVLVRRAIGVVCKGRFAKRILFQLPIISQIQTHTVSDRPIVILAFDGTR